MSCSGSNTPCAQKLSGCPAQAGGKNEAREVKTPAGLPRLFKSALDWNLYSSLQAAAHDRKARFISLSWQQSTSPFWHPDMHACGPCFFSNIAMPLESR
jgi:hypothetical protein